MDTIIGHAWSLFRQYQGEISAGAAVLGLLLGGLAWLAGRVRSRAKRLASLPWHSMPHVYHDSYDANFDNAWAIGSEDLWRRSIESGEYVWESKAGPNDLRFVDLHVHDGKRDRELDTSNRPVSVDVRIASGEWASAAGLMYRFNQVPRRYYLFLLTGAGDVKFCRFTKGAMTYLFSATLPTVSTGRFARLAIASKGRRFYLYVNDSLLRVFEDKEIKQGCVGLVAHGPGEFRFDNFSIY